MSGMELSSGQIVVFAMLAKLVTPCCHRYWLLSQWSEHVADIANKHGKTMPTFKGFGKTSGLRKRGYHLHGDQSNQKPRGLLSSVWNPPSIGPLKMLQNDRYWFWLIWEFLSGLFKIPTLSDFVFVCFIKKELNGPFKFSKTCLDFSIHHFAAFSGVLPPSTVKCCLAMFLETYVRDCLSTCRAPAICPAVNKCIALLSPLPSPPSLGPQCSKPILPLCMQSLSDLSYDTHHLGSLHWWPCVALWRTQAIACAHSSHGCSRRSSLSLVWSVCSNRVAGHCVCTLESWVPPECRRPCLSLLPCARTCN